MMILRPPAVSLFGGLLLIYIFLFARAVPALALSSPANSLLPSTIAWRADHNSLASPQAPFSKPNLHGFDLLSEQSGWVWLEDQLYWSDSGGTVWQKITPTKADGWRMVAVDFPTSSLGLALLAEQSPEGWKPAALAVTHDSGQTWELLSISLPELNPDRPAAVRFELRFLDHRHGWLTVEHASSANFSLGSLFITQNGGRTWRYAPLPVAGVVYFSSPLDGWLAGGVRREALYHSRDGGFSWEIAADFPPLKPDLPAGVLPRLQSSPRAEVQLASARAVETAGIMPAADSYPNPIWKDIQRFDFVNAAVGWAWAESGECTSLSPHAPAVQPEKLCVISTAFLSTRDGGAAWQTIPLPPPEKPENDQAAPTTATWTDRAVFSIPSAASTQPLSGVINGHGFDKCDVPSLSQLQTWRNASPYQSVNLYIGGIHRACDNLALNASFIAQARQQGWSFIPTWVGLQASCTEFKYRMSSDPNTAYAQGVNEANAAIETAASLGLTSPQKTGAVIYYDLEYYNTSKTTCNEAAKAFINGWVTQMHARGNIAGVYSNGPPLYQFSSIPNPPDVIWAAHWIYNSYNPNATVWNVYSLPNSLWANHQRLRQYTGGHSEKWGTVSMNIDSNVMDGLVSFPTISYENLTQRLYLPLILRLSP
ncbi:MAG: glycoside hydrolase domain-containing protein [Chloroflexota bacterium]